jgi:hypothetical protein
MDDLEQFACHRLTSQPVKLNGIFLQRVHVLNNELIFTASNGNRLYRLNWCGKKPDLMWEKESGPWEVFDRTVYVTTFGWALVGVESSTISERVFVIREGEPDENYELLEACACAKLEDDAIATVE